MYMITAHQTNYIELLAIILYTHPFPQVMSLPAHLLSLCKRNSTFRDKKALSTVVCAYVCTYIPVHISPPHQVVVCGVWCPQSACVGIPQVNRMITTDWDKTGIEGSIENMTGGWVPARASRKVHNYIHYICTEWDMQGFIQQGG